MKLYLFASAFLAAACCVYGQSSSTSNDQCVAITKCPTLLQILRKPDRSPADVEVLRKAACGFEGKIPKVCCPAPFTEGDCISQITAFPPDPRTGCCGIDSRAGSKIIGGTVTAIDQFPWLTLIEYLDSDKMHLLCGGALISNKYVLTAAHCLVGRILKLGTPKNVRLGEYDQHNDGPDCVTAEGGGEDCTDAIVVIPIDKTIPHADYSPSTKRHDIGLIRMQQAAPFTDFIRPVCLPTVDVTLAPPPYFMLFTAGWGAINTTHTSLIKLHVALPFVDQRECQPAYNVTGRQASLWKGQLCAGGETGKDSCKGDSGGPLMYENGRFFEVLGVISFGPSVCGMGNVPGVHSKVYEYVGWINNNIEP